MRIFLASTFSGMSRNRRKEFIEKGKPKYILETFFSGEKICKHALTDAGSENFLLDSGAFSFMNGAECSTDMLDLYAERYIRFITENKIQHYFEIDVDTIFGISYTEDLRKRIEQKTNTLCIPVWHKGRGVEYWKKMCKQYEYIAVGGLVTHIKSSEFQAIQKMVAYAYQRGVKVHGLGFTKTKQMDNWNWYSVDSSSWTKAAALGRQFHTFNGESIDTKVIGGKGYKVNISELVYHNGMEWCKYQRYMDGKRK